MIRIRNRRIADTHLLLGGVRRFYLGVLHLYAVVEHTRTAKHQIVLAYLVVLLGILATVEPHKVHDASPVAEVSHHALLVRPHVERLEAQYLPNHLHEGHVARQLAHGIDLRAIHIFIGVVL